MTAGNSKQTLHRHSFNPQHNDPILRDDVIFPLTADYGKILIKMTQHRFKSRDIVYLTLTIYFHNYYNRLCGGIISLSLSLSVKFIVQ